MLPALMNHFSWPSVAEEQMNPKFARRVIHGTHMTVASLRLLEGAIVPRHQHENEQITMVQSGGLRFEFDDEHVVVRANEVLVITPHRPHSVTALEDSEVTDLFSPVRADWQRGDDAYLRR